jgi:hypothetical protein
VADYENTMDKYPWLARDETEVTDDHNHTFLRKPLPLPPLSETEHQPWTMVHGRREYYGQIPARDLDRDSLLQTSEESIYEHEHAHAHAHEQLYEPSVSSVSVESQAAVLEDPNLVSDSSY